MGFQLPVPQLVRKKKTGCCHRHTWVGLGTVGIPGHLKKWVEIIRKWWVLITGGGSSKLWDSYSPPPIRSGCLDEGTKVGWMEKLFWEYGDGCVPCKFSYSTISLRTWITPIVCVPNPDTKTLFPVGGTLGWSLQKTSSTTPSPLGRVYHASEKKRVL